MNHEQQPFSEQRQSLPDEIIVINGIAGVRGSKGKFYPITLDMGVKVVAGSDGKPEIQSLVPETPNTDDTQTSRAIGKDMCPDTVNIDTELARFLIDNTGDAL